MDVWQRKGLRADFADVWQRKDLEDETRLRKGRRLGAVKEGKRADEAVRKRAGARRSRLILFRGKGQRNCTKGQNVSLHFFGAELGSREMGALHGGGRGGYGETKTPDAQSRTELQKRPVPTQG